MNFGVSTASYFGKLPTEASFDEIRKLGVDKCEVFLTTYSEYEQSFVNLVNDCRGDINVHSVHSLNMHFEPQLFNIVDRTRLDAEVFFRKICKAGLDLGAKYYTFHGVARLKNKNYNCDYVRLGKIVNNLIEIAQEYGMFLSYENVHWAHYAYAGYFSELFRYCSNLKATLDIKQAMQSKVDYKDYIADMKNCISTVHLCDYDGNGRLCLPGKGIFDFTKLFEEIARSGNNPAYIIEVYSGDYSNFNEIGESIEYLKKCYKNI